MFIKEPPGAAPGAAELLNLIGPKALIHFQ